MEQQTAQLGDAVIYTDPVGRDHHAVITNGFGVDGRIGSGAAINVAFVSSDSARTDAYGRQLERESSVQHQSVTPAHGRFWRFAGEAKKQESASSLAHASV
jgi:hypothetical protein